MILSFLFGLELLMIIETSNGNVALYKPTAISSVYQNGNANNVKMAVDGNLFTDLYNCSSTDYNDMDPWYMVDLKGTFLLSHVKLTNRDSFASQLQSFAIEVFSQNPARCGSAVPRLCINYTGEAPDISETATFACDQPVVGRFVRIRQWHKINTQDILCICELQAFGTLLTGCERTTNYPVLRGHRLVTSGSKILEVPSLVDCSSECLKNGTCMAFNYYDKFTECDLIFKPVMADTLEENFEWDYYGSDVCQDSSNEPV